MDDYNVYYIEKQIYILGLVAVWMLRSQIDVTCDIQLIVCPSGQREHEIHNRKI